MSYTLVLNQMFLKRGHIPQFIFLSTFALDKPTLLKCTWNLRSACCKCTRYLEDEPYKSYAWYFKILMQSLWFNRGSKNPRNSLKRYTHFEETKQQIKTAKLPNVLEIIYLMRMSPGPIWAMQSAIDISACVCHKTATKVSTWREKNTKNILATAIADNSASWSKEQESCN